MVFEAQQQGCPTQFRLPIARLQAQQFFIPLVRDADDDQNALPLIGTNIEINAIGPDIDVALLSQGPLLPVLVLSAPLRFQTTNRGGRNPFSLCPEQGAQSLAEVSR